MTTHNPIPRSGSPISYQGLIDDAKQILYSTSDTPRIDAEILLQHAIGQQLSWLIAYGDCIASAEHVKTFYGLVSKRQQGQPIAYLIGQRDFWTVTLAVNENVLIPRPDTEILIEASLQLLQSSETKNTPHNILDLGTGSGAIALSLAKERENANVTAVDFSSSALDIAKSNAHTNNINNVEFFQSDWFSALDEGQQFDLIASNPPYIGETDPHLQQGDVRFEPISALTAKHKGLADLDLIIRTAPKFLKNNSWLIVEHGYNQAEPVAQLFKDNGFEHVSLHHDLNNLPRCTAGKWLGKHT